jgi:hypothetical protein
VKCAVFENCGADCNGGTRGVVKAATMVSMEREQNPKICGNQREDLPDGGTSAIYGNAASDETAETKTCCTEILSPLERVFHLETGLTLLIP